MCASIFVKIDKMYYQGKEVFYKKPINTELHIATEFSKIIYEYYYKEKEEEPRYLGKFEGNGMYCGNPYWDDYDYPIIKFEKENVFENKKENIYCKGIPDSDENMCIIEDMMYEEFTVYYRK